MVRETQKSCVMSVHRQFLFCNPYCSNQIKSLWSNYRIANINVLSKIAQNSSTGDKGDDAKPQILVA